MNLFSLVKLVYHRYLFIFGKQVPQFPRVDGINPVVLQTYLPDPRKSILAEERESPWTNSVRNQTREAVVSDDIPADVQEEYELGDCGEACICSP